MIRKVKDIPPAIVKKLFVEVMKDQIKECYKKSKSNKVRQVVGRVLYGKITKKYRCLTQIRKEINIRPNSVVPKDERYLNYTRRRPEGANMFLNEKIVRFFEDNSRMLPGKMDFKKKRGLKKQLMYLNDTVASVYKKFCDTNRSVVVSYSSFAKKTPLLDGASKSECTRYLFMRYARKYESKTKKVSCCRADTE